MAKKLVKKPLKLMSVNDWKYLRVDENHNLWVIDDVGEGVDRYSRFDEDSNLLKFYLPRSSDVVPQNEPNKDVHHDFIIQPLLAIGSCVIMIIWIILLFIVK